MPITNVYYKPKIWSPGYNPIVWSFLSNQNTQTDFNYVVDIYVNAATGATAPTYRLLQKPNPAGVCMVDVSSIVQPYLELTNYSVEEGWSLDYRDSDGIAASVFLKVGEQYSGPSGGALTTFNGLGATGEPAYFLWAYNFDKQVRVIPAALPYEDGIQHMAATGPYGGFAPYIMRPASAGGVGKYLKRQGNSIT